MAKCGNHGQIIPRDKKLLTELYWGQQMSFPDIARLYGVEHRSVGLVFVKLGIPRRKRRAKGQSKFKKCTVCGGPIHKIKHTDNGSKYGRFCKKHWNEYRAKLAKDYKATNPEYREKSKAGLRRWYYIGAKQPTEELQWLNRSKIMLRNVRRLLGRTKTQNREALQFLNAASKLDRSLQISCRP